MNLCELGIKQKNYDRELVRAFARANDLPEEEERLEAAAIEEAERKADFLQRFGAAALACEITDELISSVWHGPFLRVTNTDFRSSFPRCGIIL